MNGHPISPFDTRICGGESLMNSPGFYKLKTHNYRLQKRVMKETLKQKSHQKMFFAESPNLIPGTPWDPTFFLDFSYFSIKNYNKFFPRVPGVPGGEKATNKTVAKRLAYPGGPWDPWDPTGPRESVYV